MTRALAALILYASVRLKNFLQPIILKWTYDWQNQPSISLPTLAVQAKHGK